MLANRTSRWSIAAALLCIVLLAASWFLLISPRRADASDIRSQTTAAEDQASLLRVKIAELKAEFADLPKQLAELKAIKKQLPPTANIPAWVRDMQSSAAETGVSLDSIVPGTPALVGAASASGVAGTGSVVSVPMTLTLTGDYFEAALFLKRVQAQLHRSYLISGLALVPAEEEATATATVAPVPTSTSTATPTATATATATAAAEPVTSLDRVSVSLTGALFVLMDGTSTLDQVTKDAKAAATGTSTKVTPTTVPVAAGGTATR